MTTWTPPHGMITRAEYDQTCRVEFTLDRPDRSLTKRYFRYLFSMMGTLDVWQPTLLRRGRSTETVIGGLLSYTRATAAAEAVRQLNGLQLSVAVTPTPVRISVICPHPIKMLLEYKGWEG